MTNTDEDISRLSGFMVCPKRISASTNSGALQHNKNITAIFKRKMHAHILEHLMFEHLMFDANTYSTPKQLKSFRDKLRHSVIPDELKPVEKEFKKTLKYMLKFIKSKL